VGKESQKLNNYNIDSVSRMSQQLNNHDTTMVSRLSVKITMALTVSADCHNT